MICSLRPTPYFLEQATKLPLPAYQTLQVKLHFLAENPRHPSLHTHEVKGAYGNFGGKVYEAYVTKKYRLTWEYGREDRTIILRNVDNHDECLKKA